MLKPWPGGGFSGGFVGPGPTGLRQVMHRILEAGRSRNRSPPTKICKAPAIGRIPFANVLPSRTSEASEGDLPRC